MEEIEKELNFTAVYYEVSAFGQLDAGDMSWSGAVGELVSKKYIKHLVWLRLNSIKSKIYENFQC